MVETRSENTVLGEILGFPAARWEDFWTALVFLQ